MYKQIYYFSYGNNIKKFISKFISLIYNFFIGIFILFLFSLIVAKVNLLLKDLVSDSILNIVNRVEVYLGVLFIIVFIIPSFLPQKVEIKEKTINIYRHCLFLSVFMFSRGFNDTILISQIRKIYIAESRDKFFKPIPVNVIDWENMVIIETETKIYYAPVKNSEGFIEEVNKRIEEIKDSSI